MSLSKKTRPKRTGEVAQKIFRAYRVHEGLRSDVDATDRAAEHLLALYPLTFEIHHVTTDEGTFYAACFGPAATVCEAQTLQEVMERLAEYRKANGFDAKRFPLKPGIVEEDLRDKPPAALAEFTQA